MRIFLFFAGVFLIFSASCQNSGSSKANDPTDTTLTLAKRIELYSKLIEETPDDTKLLLARADLFRKSGNLNNAILDVQKVVQYDNKNIKNQILLADLFLQSGQTQNTIFTLQGALAVDPNHVGALLKMAELNLMFKRYAQAIENLNKVLDQKPCHDTAFFIKGFISMEKGDTNSAISYFMESIKCNPKYYEAHIQLAVLFSNLGDPLALNYYKNAITSRPTSSEAYYNLGLYYQGIDSLNKAIDIYKQLIKINPKYPYAYYNIGYINLEMLSIPSEAIRYFDMAVQLKPDYYEAIFNLGLCYERTGDVLKARELYHQALNIKTNYPKAIEGLNRIDRK